MLHQITYILFKLRLIQPSKNTIMYWMHTNDITKLEYALKYGNYRIREVAAEAIEYVGESSSIPILLNAINDKIQNVSIAALNAIETIGASDELMVSITKKRFNWLKKIRDKEKKYQTNKGKKHNIYRWKRASKESFDRVKEQLKRPMR